MPELLQRRFTLLMPKYMGFQRSLKRKQITLAEKDCWIPSIQFFADDDEKIAVGCKFKRNCPLTARCIAAIQCLDGIHSSGFVSKVPHFNSVSNYLEMETLTPYLKAMIEESARPLAAVEWDFAVDSSGFATGQYQRWMTAKYGATKFIDKESWLKVHLMCGVKTNIVTSVEVTHAHAGDSPQFAPLVEATSRNFPVQSVAADKAYSSEKNLRLVLVKGGQPYIAFRSNATDNNRRSGTVWRQMFHFYQYNQERFMQYYHRRSNVESTFSMIKAKFGERLRSKTGTAQTNEVLCKILCHNVCCLIESIYELGIEPTFWENA